MKQPDPLVRIRWADENQARSLYENNAIFATAIDALQSAHGLQRDGLFNGEYGRMFTLPGALLGLQSWKEIESVKGDLCHEVEILNDNRDDTKMSQRTHRKTAFAWWIEYDEEEAYVCMDTDTGQTVAYDISDAYYGGEIDKTENFHMDRDPEDTEDAKEHLREALDGEMDRPTPPGWFRDDPDADTI